MGLALQGGLANMAGGMMLLLFKPFQVGDYIIVNGQDGSEGTVAKVEICYTTLLSIDNKHIVIPNGTLSNATITNVTARDQRRLEIKVGSLIMQISRRPRISWKISSPKIWIQEKTKRWWYS